MIGILVAYKAEILPFIASLPQVKRLSLYGRVFYQSNLDSIPVVIGISGRGKIRMASITELCLLHFSPSMLLHVGFAGGLTSECQIGDLFISDTLIQHDYKVKIPSLQTSPRIKISDSSYQEALSACKSLSFQYHLGTSASGDEDIISSDRQQELLLNYNAKSVDWESFSFSSIAQLHNTKHAVVKIISDHCQSIVLTDDHHIFLQNKLSQFLKKWIYEIKEGKIN